jgi:hypothetical protein
VSPSRMLTGDVPGSQEGEGSLFSSTILQRTWDEALKPVFINIVQSNIFRRTSRRSRRQSGYWKSGLIWQVSVIIADIGEKESCREIGPSLPLAIHRNVGGIKGAESI